MTSTAPSLPRFACDMWQADYEAIAYGRPWNGWATPIVTRETLATMFATEDPSGKWMSVAFNEAGVAHIIEGDDVESDRYEYDLAPDERGGYDLGVLGWTFDTIDSDTNAPA